jgi:hypothetical protein
MRNRPRAFWLSPSQLQLVLDVRAMKRDGVIIVELCTVVDCPNRVWAVGTWCKRHFLERLNALSLGDDLYFKDALERALCSLSYLERQVLKLRTGIDADRRYSVTECARIFRLDTSRVRAIEQRAFKKFRLSIRDCQLEAYF